VTRLNSFEGFHLQVVLYKVSCCTNCASPSGPEEIVTCHHTFHRHLAIFCSTHCVFAVVTLFSSMHLNVQATLLAVAAVTAANPVHEASRVELAPRAVTSHYLFSLYVTATSTSMALRSYTLLAATLTRKPTSTLSEHSRIAQIHWVCSFFQVIVHHILRLPR
jgi:hypothetical protein